MAKIYAGRCSSYQLEEVQGAIEKALAAFGGINNLVRPGDRVLLKPNLLFGRSADTAITTHPGIVEAMIQQVLAAGANPFIGDSPALGSARQAAEACGIGEVARRYGVEIVEFNQPRQIRLAGGRRVTLDAQALDADKIINLPKFKSHQQLWVTGPVKNFFGCVNGKRKPVWHFRLGDREKGVHFGRMLVEIASHLNPVFTLVDGVVGMEGSGPLNGTPRPLHLLLAGQDLIALERAMLEVINLPFETPILQAARQLGLGQADLDRIEIVGEPLSAFQVNDFILPDMMPIFFNSTRVIRSYFKAFIFGIKSRSAS